MAWKGNHIRLDHIFMTWEMTFSENLPSFSTFCYPATAFFPVNLVYNLYSKNLAQFSHMGILVYLFQFN